MKKILNYLSVFFMIFVGSVVALNFGIFSTTTNMKSLNSGNGDFNSPKCSIAISSSVRIGKETTGMITCSDDNLLKDTDIQISDILVNQGLIKKIKITRVYNKTVFNDGKSCAWNFKYKGIFFGKAEVKLRQQAVSDYSGNANWTSNSVSTLVKLF